MGVDPRMDLVPLQNDFIFLPGNRCHFNPFRYERFVAAEWERHYPSTSLPDEAMYRECFHGEGKPHTTGLFECWRPQLGANDKAAIKGRRAHLSESTRL